MHSLYLTTDTKPKLISREIRIGEKKVAITGFAKGSGMIRPDFATLLSFVFIDGKLNSNSLEKIHSNALSESFEALTVDGDTSPNDSSLLVASGNQVRELLARPETWEVTTYDDPDNSPITYLDPIIDPSSG